MPSDISLDSKSDFCFSSSVGCSESLCSYSLFEQCLSERTVTQAQELTFISFFSICSSFGPRIHQRKQEVLTVLQE